MTDGQSNTGAPLMELEQILKRESIPLFAIGLGNPEKAKNIKINYQQHLHIKFCFFL